MQKIATLNILCFFIKFSTSNCSLISKSFGENGVISAPVLKMFSVGCKSLYNFDFVIPVKFTFRPHIKKCGKVKHKLGVPSYEFKSPNCEFKSIRYEFKSLSYEFKFMS